MSNTISIMYKVYTCTNVYIERGVSVYIWVCLYICLDFAKTKCKGQCHRDIAEEQHHQEILN